MKKFINKYYYFGINAIAILLLFWFLSVPFFEKVNNFFSDLLQGEVPVRSEIVIVGIDDKSLKEVETLPWKRETTANLLNKILSYSPKAVGVDILFLDKKEGDDELGKVLESSSIPIALGAKYEDDNSYESYFKGDNIYNAYINFPLEVDGKVRNTFGKYGDEKSCLYSFSYALYHLYRGSLKKKNCDLVAGQESITGDLKIGLSYSRAPFRTISAADVLQGKIEKKDLENKIVLIGATSTDISATLSDTFFDIFGRKVSGVYIHAQALNTYMQNVSFWYIPALVMFIASLAISSLFLFYLRRSPALMGFVYLIVTEIFALIAALILYEFGVIVPFITLSLIILGTYILNVALRYIEEYNKNKIISDSFSKYVNPHILKKIIAEPELLKLGGERRNMTVLFSDIRGFTTFSEKLAPEKLVEILNQYLDGMSNVILAHEGTIDKYIGDAIMAFWNAPVSDKKHALHAIMAALAMKSELERQNKEYNIAEKLSIGIGINTGDMVVGNIGSSKRFNFTVLGDQVNLASRLEGLTKKYHVFAIVSDSTVKELGTDLEGKVIFRQLDVVQVKGKSEAVAIYEPLVYSQENLEATNAYMKAFIEYQKGNFEAAIGMFNDIENDGPSQMMIERIKSIQKSPKSFNGVWTWDEK